MGRGKRGEGRARIEEAALALFAERGFAGASTSAIAERAGVAEGTIFRHFKSKKALLMGLMSRAFERLAAPAMAREVLTLFEQEHASLEAFLTELLEERLAFAERGSVILRVLIQEYALHDELRETVHRVFAERVLPAFEAKIVRMISRGLIADLPPTAVVQTILTAFGGFGIARYALLPDAPWDDAAHRSTIIHVLARGLAPSTSDDSPLPAAG